MLTRLQSSILDFIRDSIRQDGGSPTIAEIQRRFELASPASVTEHLNALERKGAVRRVPGKARNIRVVDEEKAAPAVSVPIFGAIPAGFAELSEQQPERLIAVDTGSLGRSPGSRLFGLEVRGDSMVGAGILDGDVVILEHELEPRNGDIVAALIDGETTLKRYRVRNRKPYLQAENPSYPELVPARELLIQGVFRALVRVPGGGRHGGR